jgi:hypothetical protein
MSVASRWLAATAVGAGGLMQLLGSTHLSPLLSAGALATFAIVILTATGVIASVVLTAARSHDPQVRHSSLQVLRELRRATPTTTLIQRDHGH